VYLRYRYPPRPLVRAGSFVSRPKSAQLEGMFAPREGRRLRGCVQPLLRNAQSLWSGNRWLALAGRESPRDKPLRLARVFYPSRGVLHCAGRSGRQSKCLHRLRHLPQGVEGTRVDRCPRARPLRRMGEIGTARQHHPDWRRSRHRSFGRRVVVWRADSGDYRERRQSSAPRYRARAGGERL
jgi:hypothetical protein